MSQSLARIIVHLVFSTKHRKPLIRSEIEKELYAFMVSLCAKRDCPVHEIGAMPDHLHICFTLSRTLSLSDLVEKIKAISSKWIKTKGNEYRTFAWQNGYGAFSLGQSQIPAVKNYIKNQKQHHIRQTFQDEYLSLLKKYQLSYDERYLWD